MDFMTPPATDATVSTDQQAQTPADTNFANMRKMLEDERRQRSDLEARTQTLENEKASWASKVAAQVEDDDDDEPYVDPKTLNRKLAGFRAEFETLIEEKAEKKARSMMEEDRKDTYLKSNKDFHDTLSPETLQKFADTHPSMAEAILRMPESFERQKLIYESIKSTGLNKKEEVSSVQGQIDKNRKNYFYNPSGHGSAPYSAVGDFSQGGQKKAYEKLQELKGRMKMG